MTIELSKMIKEKLTLAESLIKGLDTHLQRLLKGVQKQLEQTDFQSKTGVTPETIVQGVGQTVGELLNYLRYSNDRLAFADREHLRELKEDEAARLGRDTSFGETLEALNRLRDSIQGSHGMQAVSSVGLEGTQPRHPGELLSRLEKAAGAMKSKSIILPPPTKPYMPAWTVPQIEQAITDLFNQFKASMDLVEREQLETQGTVTTKWKAMDIQSNAFRAVSLIAEGLSILAEEEALLERLYPRQSSPRSPKAQDDTIPSTDATATPSPGTDNTATPSPGADNTITPSPVGNSPNNTNNTPPAQS